MQFSFTTQLLKEGDTYIGYSPEFDLSSCGDNPEEARTHLREAVTFFLDEARRLGTLEQILEESGFTKKEKEWIAPEFLGFEHQAVAV